MCIPLIALTHGFICWCEEEVSVEIEETLDVATLYAHAFKCLVQQFAFNLSMDL